MGELPKVQTSAVQLAGWGPPSQLMEAAPGSGAWWSWRPRITLPEDGNSWFSFDS